MESANSERFVYPTASRPESDGDCAQKYHRAVARISQCSVDGAVAVAVTGLCLSVANPPILGRGSTDVDVPLLVFLLDCNLMFVCQVGVP